MNAASVGVDLAVLGAFNLWIAALTSNTNGQIGLVSFVVHEARPDLGEVKAVSKRVIAQLSSDATGVAMPWSNYDRMTSLWFWCSWIEGSNICALPHPSQPIIRVPLGFPPNRLVGPPLTVSSGELDVLLITSESKELGLVRFVPAREEISASGSVLWRWPLVTKPVGASAAIGPAKIGSPRGVLFAMENKDGVTLQLLYLADGRRPQNPVNIRIPHCRAIPGVEPGLRIDEQGVSHLSLLVAADSSLREVSIVDVSVLPNGSFSAETRMSPARKLEQAVVAGCATYQSRPDKPMRRDWAVLLADGSIVHSQSGGKPMRPHGKPVTPLQMVAMSQATYFLSLAEDGPHLEPLR
jgi:hypothetical protein